MRKNYFFFAAALAMGWCATAQAVDLPTLPLAAPVNGGKYVLVNAYTPTGYMSRTSWDGAFYFLGKDDSKYADHAFTAEKNADGTFSFYYSTMTANEEDGSQVEVRSYVSTANGSCNLNAKVTTQTKWEVEVGDITGFYRLRAGEGNLSGTQGYNLHLNGSGQYFVISEEDDGGSWYPDYAGGTVAAEEGDEYTWEDNNGNMWKADKTGRCILADATSENWGFLKLEDAYQYYTIYEVYGALTRLEREYVTIDDFGDGFRKTVDAGAAILNGAEFDWENESAGIMEMVNTKIKLYEAIVAAQDINDADATLENAISNAKNVFDTATAADQLTLARTALEEAVKAFQLGTGDLTAMGTNMSFEDLSAQGGNETSGVAAPPYGWRVYVDGNEVKTTDEVKAAGIANWHGANSDSDGEGKDGNEAFGLWTSGVPAYEISQKIDGLENGTYVVSAGLMVGANTSGSRRTTQRIFGNLNATYFGAREEYDEQQLDASEVYAFQGNTEEVTDRTLQPIQVRAYVYDGTLTFGLRTDGNIAAALRDTRNGAGGDGWFKVDNFRIQKVGYVGEDAANVANHYLDALKNFEGEEMEEKLDQELAALTSKYASFTAEMPADEINAAIATMLPIPAKVQKSIAAYVRINAVVEEAYLKLDSYALLPGYDAALAVVDEISDKALERALSAEDIETAITDIENALQECVKSGIKEGEYAAIIKNPSFEDLSAQGNANSDGVVNPPAGWTLKFNGNACATTGDYAAAGASMGWCAINSGDAINETDQNETDWTVQYTDGTHLWGIWAANMPDVELSQTFTGLPAGTYELTCDMVVQYNWGGPSVTTQRIFANNFVQMYGAEDTYAEGLNDTDDMKAAKALDAANPDADLTFMNYAGWINDVQYGYTSCPHKMKLRFALSEGQPLTIGFRTNNVDPNGTPHPYDSAGWFKLDNFKLLYESTDVPTAIKAAAAEKTATLVGQKFYTVGGAQVSAPQRGINIVKSVMSDGTVKVAKILK